jgi:hypothetical protein
MIAHALASRRFRAILDCLLILLLALVLSTHDDNARAQAGSRAAAGDAIGYESMTLLGNNPVVDSPADHAPANLSPLTAPAVLDNNTLAAVIAAENAALTPPQYLLDLPLLQH